MTEPRNEKPLLLLTCCCLICVCDMFSMRELIDEYVLIVMSIMHIYRLFKALTLGIYLTLWPLKRWTQRPPHISRRHLNPN